MDNEHFFVVPYPARGPNCHKMEMRRKFAGKKIRRFRDSEAEAYAVGDELVAQIQNKGTSSIESIGMSVKAAIKRFWAQRGPAIKGKAHRAHLERNLRLFGEKYGERSIESITAIDLHNFWNRKEWPDGKSTRWQAFTYLRIFFNWLERYDLIGKNPIRRVDPPTEPDPLRGIFNAAQMKECLNPPHQWIKGFVSLTGLAGLRPSEALRVNPEKDLDWKGKEIRVVGSDDNGNRIEESGAKGERFVKMEPAFIRHCPKDFKFPNQRNFYKNMRNFAKTTSIGEFPQDVFRHTWFTHHLAKSKNAAETAHEGGNSEKMVKKVYALAAKRADQKAFWAL